MSSNFALRLILDCLNPGSFGAAKLKLASKAEKESNYNQESKLGMVDVYCVLGQTMLNKTL